MDATASSQTGCSDLASAPELFPSGARAAATSPPAFVNKPFFQLLPNSLFAELDAHNWINPSGVARAAKGINSNALFHSPVGRVLRIRLRL